jgi:hypothetical protein
LITIESQNLILNLLKFSKENIPQGVLLAGMMITKWLSAIIQKVIPNKNIGNRPSILYKNVHITKKLSNLSSSNDEESKTKAKAKNKKHR